MKKEQKELKKAAQILSKISHPYRLKLVLNLIENKCCVKDIGEGLGVPQATASHHLKQLREAGVVKNYRKGTSVLYCVEDPWVIDLLLFLKEKVEDKII